MKRLVDNSGYGWDDVKKIPTASPEVWDVLTIEDDDEVEKRDGNELLDALQDHRHRKKAREAPPSVYRVFYHQH